MSARKQRPTQAANLGSPPTKTGVAAAGASAGGSPTKKTTKAASKVVLGKQAERGGAEGVVAVAGAEEPKAKANGKALSKSAKANAVANAAVSLPPLSWSPIVEGSMSRHPAVFTKDADYFFLAASSSVKIHSRTTGQVVSTLSAVGAPSSSGTQKGIDEAHTAAITGMLINPQNPLQLITASLDGTIKIWDFLDAVLLKSIAIGYPVTHVCAHADSKGHVFVAVRKPSQGAKTAPGSQGADPLFDAGRVNSIIYSVSLATAEGGRSGSVLTRKPKELLRIGKTREAAGLQISPDGKWLVVISNRKVHVARMDQIRDGFTKYVSDQRLTCLAFHPTESYFATGDAEGKIRLWYCLDNAFMAQQAETRGDGTEKRAPTSTMHWHAHAVGSIAFSPNGAYLLSGGEEAVLVLWQLASGQKEFVPRLGAPIASVAVANGLDGREQEYAVGLMDGSMVFVGAMNLKPLRTFSRVKIDSSRSLYSQSHLATLPSPLAVQPGTGYLVMAAGHPSSLQFFDVASDSHVLEVEVAPSNRVSRPDEAPIEPTRIERAVFSTGRRPSGEAGEWMATVDSREGGQFTSELSLKFWQWNANLKTYVLNTRIDKPHDVGITSMSFSPQGADEASHLFVTTGKDGKVKTWRIASHTAKGGRRESYWICRSSFGYRDQQPADAAWAPDGSLLAIVQGPFVTLWEPATNTMQQVLSCPEVRTARQCVFTGRGGRYLAVTGAKTLILWDLVMGTVQWQAPVVADRLLTSLVDPESFVTISCTPRQRKSTITVFNARSSTPLQRFSLPFHVREASWDPLNVKTSTTPSFLAVTDRFDVVQIGEGAQKLPASGEGAQSLRGVTIARRTLFDDLFGALDDFVESSALASTSGAVAVAPTPRPRPGAQDGLKGLFDAPAHMLPPVSMLWQPFVDSILPKRSLEAEATAEAAAAGKDAEMQDDESDVGEGRGEEEEGERKRTAMDLDQAQQVAAVTSQDLSFLTDLFRELASTGPSAPEAAPAVPQTPRSKPNGISKPKPNGLSKPTPQVSTPTSATKGGRLSTPSSAARSTPHLNGHGKGSAKNLAVPSSPAPTASPAGSSGAGKKRKKGPE